MCGFAGLLTRTPASGPHLEELVGRMADAIAHRGPDDRGVWSDAAAGVALGFRRLSIVDLSAQGHQPMVSPSGRFTMVFNGEVYNHRELRRELAAAGFGFRGHSDTETMLAAFEHWGLEASLRRFVGMFAIAVWDASERTLSLVRDRLGIKPLFIYRDDRGTAFASELKALLRLPHFDRTLDQAALGAYLRYLYVPAPDSIFARVTKLLPGHILTLSSPVGDLPRPVPYWSAAEAAEVGANERFTGGDAEAVDGLEELLGDAVRMRLQADVPVGALLSGGLDSSTVVALAQARSDRPLRTYSIGFDVAAHDEAAQAARVARHLGTDHTELRMTAGDALEVVPRLPELFDEPLADPSQIPTYLICGLARREVVVALTGDGGDEVLGGYHRYLQGERVIPAMLRVPRRLRRVVAAGIDSVPADTWSRGYDVVSPLLPGALRHRLPGEKLAKMANLMRRESAEEMYRSLLSTWAASDGAIGQNGSTDRVQGALTATRGLPLLERMMLTDQTMYLPDDLLAKVDRASMAVSLEVRVPLLDHRVVEYSWRLPRQMKVRDGVGKWALRQVLYRHVPRALVDRPKVGFTVPTAEWLRGPLRGWAEDMLGGDLGVLERVTGAGTVERSWRGFLRGRSDAANFLWAVLMFRAWEDRWLSS